MFVRVRLVALVLAVSWLGCAGEAQRLCERDQVCDASRDAGRAESLTLRWVSPSDKAPVSGVVSLTLAGTSLVNVEVFQAGTLLTRCALTGDTAATCAFESTAFPNGELTLTAHGWNNVPGQPFTAEAEAGPLTLLVQNAGSDWSPLSVMAVENPMTHGATGTGLTSDLSALTATIDALPASGGLVYFPPGKVFRKDDLLVITKAHVKLWAPNGQATLLGKVNGTRRKQSTMCRNTSWCGFFGLKFTSDATARFDALEDNQLSTDNSTDIEVSGCDIDNSAAAGLFFYTSTRRVYVNGNFVHNTWADHVHHTAGTRQSWVWDNFFYNSTSSLGDDGIACVTYCPTCPKCGDMEWWGNTHLGSGWGRGYAVVGGDHIDIHHNWAIKTAGAGILVASEGGYNSATDDDLTVHSNYLNQCGQKIGHANILVSAGNPDAGPISNVAFDSNVSTEGLHGNYHVEGPVANVTNTNLSQNLADLPSPRPTVASIHTADTAILKTMDTSFVAAAQRTGLYRIHVRQAGDGGFEQRFEYVIKGTAANVSAFTTARQAAGDRVLEERTLAGTSYAIVLAPQPRSVPANLSGVTFTELRARDNDGTASWLWSRINTADY